MLSPVLFLFILFGKCKSSIIHRYMQGYLQPPCPQGKLTTAGKALKRITEFKFRVMRNVQKKKNYF